MLKFENTSDYGGTYKNKGIKVYTVGLGDVSSSYLENMASLTGGEYFYAETVNELSNVFKDFEEEITNNDKNKDGLNDNITKLICEGEITTSTGTTIFCPEAYDYIMQSADYDGDGLKNGEEIEISYYRGIPYISMWTSPEFMDSDFDGYSDYEEKKIYHTSSLQENYIVSVDDMMDVTHNNYFESYMAANDYEDVGLVEAGFNMLMDVVFGGGEADVNKIASSELADSFSYYITGNEDAIECQEYVNIICDMSEGLAVGMPTFLEICTDIPRHDMVRKVNNLQEQIMSLRGVANSKQLKKQLKKQISGLKSDFAKYEGKFKKAKKLFEYSKRAMDVISIIGVAVDEYEEAIEYYNTLKLIVEYEDILQELQYCGNINTEVGAQKIAEDMKDIEVNYGKIIFKTAGNVLLGDVMEHAGNIIEKSLGLYSLSVDLAVIATGYIIGEAFGTELNNYVTVDITRGINRATYKSINLGTYRQDENGKKNIISYDNCELIKRMWLFSICTTMRSEIKYLEYLQDDRIFMDSDFFLETSEYSEMNAKSNIQMLQEMYNKYCVR